MIAPGAEIFAVDAIEVALHGHIIDRYLRGKRLISARQFQQISKIGEHCADYKTPRRGAG